MKLLKVSQIIQACYRRSSVSISASNLLKTSIDKEIETIRSSGTWKSERVILGRQGPTIKVRSQASELLNFCANNYLGLSSHPRVIEAAIAAMKSHGSGLSSVRFICGTTDLHLELEEKLALFHGRDAAILYGSCFDANGGLFEALLTEQDAVLSDELNHASIIDGIRLCKANKWRYRNGHTEDLERCLREAATSRMRMIVTDGVFSMDGNICPLKKIVSLAKEHAALVFVDDCHGTGFLGETGRGTEQYWGLSPADVDIVNSTLGKALGGAMGGYTVGPRHVIDILRQRSRPYLFSNSLPPGVVAASLQALSLIMSGEGDLLMKIRQNTIKFRTEMRQIGFTVLGDEAHPICPVMLGDAKLAGIFAEEMLKRGVYVVAFSFPVVARGKARIRVQLSAVHTVTQIDRVVAAFKEVGLQLGVIGA